MDRGVIIVVLCMVLRLGIQAEAQTQDIAQGQTLYQQHCGICHGILASTGTEYRFTPPLVRLAVLPQVTTGEQVAVAPPHGPSLQGVYGRPAGTVQGFTYSRAFQKVLQGVVWDNQTLDKWIADSQAWVPGSLMFYKQPDVEIRRQIIRYLQANR